MRLYLLRHGPAEDAADASSESPPRQLTQEGAEQVRRFAGRLAHTGLTVEAVLSSPLTRAAQTAEIVVQALRPPEPLQLDQRLAPGFAIERLEELLAEHDGDDLLLVGHEPDFSDLVESLTGGRVSMSETGLARVDIDRTRPPSGVLAWLVTPRALLGDEAPDHDFSHQGST